MGVEGCSGELRVHSAEPPNRWRKLDGQTLCAYVGAIVLCLLVLGWALRLWRSDLTIPFVYSGDDGFFYIMLAKGLVDNGWVLHNRFLGMPMGLALHDFPIPDNLHLLLMKFIALWTSHYAMVFNLYFLLTFPLCVITSLLVFRTFGVSFPPAIVGSLLFAFLPYHFWRGEVHFFLAAYYLIPLMVMVILWICLGTPLFRWGRGDRLPMGKRVTGKGVAGVTICVLMASGGAYYAFFAGIFLLVAGVIAVARQRVWQPILTVGLLAMVLFVTFAINILPSLIYAYQYGKNNVHQRLPEETEFYGLKVSQLLLPISNHRVGSLAHFKDTYNRRTPFVTENDFATLGMIGSVGFLVLIGWLIVGRPESPHAELFNSLAVLNISGLLWTMIGGFGSLFAWLVSPQFRGINRGSVYLGFFALFAVVLLLDNLGRRWGTWYTSKASRHLFYGVLGVILFLGLLDQTSPSFVPRYKQIEAVYRSDAEFIRRVEAAVPEGAMIFQLPYMSFPESPVVHGLLSYDHFRGYFHSNTLRWSFGAMRDREGDKWQRQVALKPLPALVEAVAMAGFRGLYLNRDGYADQAAVLEERLTRLLETSPIVSPDQRLLFFNLDRVRGNLARNGSSAFTQGMRTDLAYFTGWTPLPIGGKTWASPAAAVYQGALHLVVRGTHDYVYHTWAAPSGWTAWTPLAISTPSVPALAEFMGELWVVVRGRDDSIYANRWFQGHWRGWIEVSGAHTLSGPAVVNFQEEFYVFARAMDNSLQVNRFYGTHWRGWSEVVGDRTLSRPAAVSFQDALYVFIHASDNSLQMNRFDGSHWAGWKKVPNAGINPSELSAVVFGNNLYVLVRGMDGAIEVHRFDGNHWQRLPDVNASGLTSSGPSAVANDTTLSLLVRSMNNDILVGHLHAEMDAPNDR